MVLRDLCLSDSLSHRPYSNVLRPSRRSSRKRFSVNNSIASSPARSDSFCSDNISSVGNYHEQKLRRNYLVAKGTSFPSALPIRFFSGSSVVQTKTVPRADVIDGPNDVGHLDQAEPVGDPSVPETTGRSGEPPRLSSLYVPRLFRERYVSVLSPHLNFDKPFANVESLANELLKRKGYEAFTVDKLKQLKQGWEKFTNLKSEVDKIDDKRFEITKQRRTFIDKMKSDGSELKGKEKELFDSLGVDMLKIRNKLKALIPQLNDLELTVVPDLLQIPNTVDKTTPLLEDKVLFCLYNPPEFDFPAKSHMQLGDLNQTLELSDVAPGAFYLLGDLAQAELALQDLLKDQLGTHFKYLQHANPDFGNGVTVEGCGYAIHDPTEVLRLMAHSASSDSKEFLTGGSSLPSFAGYFAKKAVTKTNKFLPQKLFSIGRLYTPRKMIDVQETTAPVTMTDDFESTDSGYRQTGLEANEFPAIDCEHRTGKGQGILSSMQSTSISAFVVDTKESHSEEDVVNELLAISTAVYAKLGLHFRIVQKHAKSLKSFEKKAYSIEMVTTSFQRLEISSPDSLSSANNCSSGAVPSSMSVSNVERRHAGCEPSVPLYTEVGRISVIGDYVSKRLLMLYDKRDVLGGGPKQRAGGATRYGFLNVVFSEVMNVSKFLAVMMENTQTKTGRYEIPAVLLEYPMMTEAGGNEKNS